MLSCILFGFKGCGKTHYGQLLSAALKWSFIDTDDRVVQLYAQHTGAIHSIRTIYQTLGESAFRELERVVIGQINLTSHTIIALGGGVILDPSNVDHLQQIGRFIYLKIDFETIGKRILESELPSFIDAAQPWESLSAIYRERKAIYESIPAESVDVSAFNETAVMQRLMEIARLQSGDIHSVNSRRNFQTGIS